MDLEERSGVDPVIERTCAECGTKLTTEEIMASLELFAKEVMPEFLERHETVQKPWREQQLEGVPYLNNSTI